MKIQTKIIILSAICFLAIFSLSFEKDGNIQCNIAIADSIVVDSTDAQRATVLAIRERFGIPAYVNEHGVVTSIGGERINIGLASNDPVERTYEFFELNHDLFNIINPYEELPLKTRTITEFGSGHIKLYQKANGIKVEGGYYYIDFMTAVDSQRVFLYSVNGVYFPEARNVNPNPVISKTDAESIAASDPIHEGANVIKGPTSLQIRSINGECRLIWRTGITNGGYGGVAEYWIDANTGTILLAKTALR